MDKILVLTGPTATGKTELSVEIAHRWDVEIISCDSMQVYKYMDIGTAKPPADILEKIPHHLIGYVEPDEEYNVVRFARDAKKAINDILSRGRLPVITGGSGLYLNSLIFDIDFSSKNEDPQFRKELQSLDRNDLYDMLVSLDPEAAKRIHPNNVKRVIRALEIARYDKKHTYSSTFGKKASHGFDFLIFALTMKREHLYENINKRVEDMFEQGLIDETRKLIENGILKSKTALNAIGYKEVIRYLQNEIPLLEAKELIKKNTRNYAKRQMTWLRKIEGVRWLDKEIMSKEEMIDEIGKSLF